MPSILLHNEGDSEPLIFDSIPVYFGTVRKGTALVSGRPFAGYTPPVVTR